MTGDNPGPFTSYSLYFGPPVSGKYYRNYGLRLPDRQISGAVSLEELIRSLFNNDNDNDNDNEKIVLTTMLTIKIQFTINSLEKKKNYSFKTLFTIPVDLKST